MKPFTFMGTESDFGLSPFAAILLLCPTILRLFVDYVTIERLKIEVDHKVHTLYTVALMAAIALMIPSPANWFQCFLFQGAIFWLLFDYSLNLLRGLKWDYVDQGLDGHSSWFDSQYKRFGTWPVLFFKVWVFAVGFCVYFFLSMIIN